MFKKIFKSVKDKLFNAGKKQEPPKAAPLTPDIPPTKPNETVKVRVSRKERRSRKRIRTERTPPTKMPGIDPLDKRKHPGSPTSRYSHKPWPFKKKEVA